MLERRLSIDCILKGFLENLAGLFCRENTEWGPRLPNLLGFLRCFRNGMVERMSTKR